MLKTLINRRFEIVAADTVWYHGRKTKKQEFDLDKTGEGHDAEGPGFYFSSDKSDASSYGYPDGIVMKVALHPRKLVTLQDKANKKELKALIMKANDYEGTLMNWDENLSVAMETALSGTIKRNPLAKDAFQQVWYDFYRYRPADYLKNMIALGYDGQEIQLKSGGIKHIVIFNTSAIKVLEVEDL